jgi:hypothetical protein
MPTNAPIDVTRPHKLLAAGAVLAAAAGVGGSVATEAPAQPARGRPATPHRTAAVVRHRTITRHPRARTHRTSIRRRLAPADRSHGYSIPASIVMCESGGNYSAVNPSSGAGGAYQIMPSTWTAYGGSGLPQDAPPAEQDAIAAKIYATAGPGAWSCS